MTIDPKTAVTKAFESADMLFDTAELKNLGLEEIEYSERDNTWHVTLGYDTGRRREVTKGPALFPETTYESERKYKTFVLKGDTGDFVKMLRD
jgi:hypothetical protein